MRACQPSVEESTAFVDVSMRYQATVALQVQFGRSATGTALSGPLPPPLRLSCTSNAVVAEENHAALGQAD